MGVAHWAQSKGHFSSLGQKLNFEIWFFAHCDFIPTPWGPQISILRFQNSYGAILQGFEVKIVAKMSIFHFVTYNFWDIAIFDPVTFKPK